jgi:hypothetical protein
MSVHIESYAKSPESYKNDSERTSHYMCAVAVSFDFHVLQTWMSKRKRWCLLPFSTRREGGALRAHLQVSTCLLPQGVCNQLQEPVVKVVCMYVSRLSHGFYSHVFEYICTGTCP